MEWLRNSNIRRSFTRKKAPSISKEFDQIACYTSFQRHWQQALDTIDRTQRLKSHLQSDDVLAVISHMDQMMTLLVMELKIETCPTCCLDYLLSENILDKIQYWASKSGEYLSTLKLEQLKMYETLISNSKRELLVHEPVLRPLLKLLLTCVDCAPVEVEKRLVILLNQLCVSLVQNNNLVDVFFYAPTQDNNRRFIIFSLLVPFVHREGAIGQQARDALLLCMALSKENLSMAKYIAQKSNFCPILATGLSGLYSVLPRKLQIDTEGWHCFTIEDANDIPELSNFLNSLEFCNAVVQMADDAVREQLLDYIYQGFLIPVMGPALHQDSLGLSYENTSVESTIVEETVMATAYFNLFLRSITEPSLLQIFLRFLLCHEYDETRIIDILIARINAGSRLCLVTLSLFENLLDLNSEDLLLDIVFQYLLPCTHVMHSHRNKIKTCPIDSQTPERFLSLIPRCVTTPQPSTQEVPRSFTSLDVTSNPRHRRHNSTASESETAFYSLPEVPPLNGEYGIGSYVEYLTDAHYKIENCKLACDCWTYSYDTETPPPLVKPDIDETGAHYAENNMVSVSSGYESLRGNTPELVGERDDVLDTWEEGEGKENGIDGGIVGEDKNDGPDIGPFLSTLFRKVETMPFNSFYVNLHLTGVLSRLAVYPQPLLRSFLLDSSLVLQPSICSLAQVIGSVKQHVDEHTSRIHQVEDLVSEAKKFISKREEVLDILKYNTIPDQTKRRISSPELQIQPSRRSLPMFLSVIRKYNIPIAAIKENVLESTPDGSGYRYVHNLSIEERTNVDEFMKTRHVILCAVLLEDWLKELSAIAQEHATVC